MKMLLKDQMEKQGIWLFRFRGILPLIILGFGSYEYFQTELHPELYPLEETRYEIIFEMFCLAISIIGLIVRIITVGYTPANTSGRNVKEQVADRLNTSGMYSLVRNPLYLGNFLIWFGISMLTMNFWFIIAFCLVYWVYYERIIFAEEQFLTRKFGDEYKEWAEITPCFILQFKNYKKADLPFSWRKVIKKEKNALVALLLVFSALDILGELIMNEPPKYMPLAIITAIVFVFYLIIKYIKRKTTLLDEVGR